jgi:hypothetical protein
MPGLLTDHLMPGVDVRVRLELLPTSPGDDSLMRTWVEGRRDGRHGTELGVAAPVYFLQRRPPQLGRHVRVNWVNERGLLVIETALCEVVSGRVPVWWLEPVVPTAVIQRRQFARAPVAGNLWIGQVTEEGAAEHVPAQLVPARLMDIGEGGLRAWAPAAAVGESDYVKIKLEIDGHVLEVDAPVVRRQRLDARTFEIVIALGGRRDWGDIIRRAVLEHQRRSRQHAGAL